MAKAEATKEEATTLAKEEATMRREEAGMKTEARIHGGDHGGDGEDRAKGRHTADAPGRPVIEPQPEIVPWRSVMAMMEESAQCWQNGARHTLDSLNALSTCRTPQDVMACQTRYVQEATSQLFDSMSRMQSLMAEAVGEQSKAMQNLTETSVSFWRGNPGQTGRD